MSNLLTSKELEEIKERTDKATPGEWIPNGYEDETEFHLESLESSEGYMVGTPADPVTGDFVFFREEDVPFFTKARQDIPRLLQHIEELEKALRDATDGMVIETITSENERGISNGWRKVGKTVITQVGYSEKYIAFVDNEAKELWAWLRTKEAGSGEGEKDV